MDRPIAIVSLLALLTIGLMLSATGLGAGSAAHSPRSTVLADPGERDAAPRGMQEPSFVAVAGAAANNTTQHENPEVVGGRSDIRDITRWLELRLADRLGRSTVELSQGEADIAKRLLGDEFADQFERYAYVVGQTESNTDDRASEQFHETRATQEEFATAVQQYRETRQEYEEARRTGDEGRARRLARELQRLSRRTNQSGSELRGDYSALSSATTVDLSDASLTVQNISENITRRQAEIRAETFMKTTLAVQPGSRQISFIDPLRLTGQLTGENGSTLAGRTVRLRIGERTIRTETNTGGTFTATYRPTLLRADQQPVTVRFVPRNDSIYLGSNESVTVSVSQVTPDLSVERTPETVAFDERIEVNGTVSAEGIGAEAVPVTIRLGGVRLGTTRTTPDGTYSLDTRLPASVDDGDQRLTVVLPLERQALARVDQSKPVTVDPTVTELTVSGEQVGETTVRVSGTLATVQSSGIADQPVELLIDGQSVATARTTEDGSFSERVSVPSSIVPADRNVSVTLAARYDRPASNLRGSRARTALRLQPFAGGPSGAGGVGDGSGSLFSVPEDVPLPLVALILSGLLVLVGGAVYTRRRRADSATTAPDEEPSASVTDLRSMEPPVRPIETPSPMLAEANTALADGDGDTAVKLAYTALKRDMTEHLGVPDGTHWEFFVACEATDLDEDRIAVLRRMTEAYERAAFSPTTVPETEANWVLDAASTFEY